LHWFFGYDYFVRFATPKPRLRGATLSARFNGIDFDDAADRGCLGGGYASQSAAESGSNSIFVERMLRRR